MRELLFYTEMGVSIRNVTTTGEAKEKCGSFKIKVFGAILSIFQDGL